VTCPFPPSLLLFHAFPDTVTEQDAAADDEEEQEVMSGSPMGMSPAQRAMSVPASMGRKTPMRVERSGLRTGTTFLTE
jgi:hypothetical protein